MHDHSHSRSHGHSQSHGHSPSHGHSQSHGHGHSHGQGGNFDRAFKLGIGLNLVFVALEAVFGWISGSLALLADAGHNLSDVMGLALAWGAHALARRPATLRRTYGFRRATILASLASALLLLVALGAITFEAVGRFREPAPVESGTIILVAAVGVVINTATALLFMRGQKGDLNIRGAFLHMAADAGVSLGVVLAGLGIRATGWSWLDPAVSLAIVAVILVGTWGLLRDSTALAMDAVPPDIDAEAVKSFLQERPGVEEVHDLHIWAMSTTEAALTAHLVMPGGTPGADFLEEVSREIHERFDIHHTTIQIEHGEPCEGRDCR